MSLLFICVPSFSSDTFHFAPPHTQRMRLCVYVTFDCLQFTLIDYFRLIHSKKKFYFFQNLCINYNNNGASSPPNCIQHCRFQTEFNEKSTKLSFTTNWIIQYSFLPLYMYSSSCIKSVVACGECYYTSMKCNENTNIHQTCAIYVRCRQVIRHFYSHLMFIYSFSAL